MNFNFILAGSSQPFVNKLLRKIRRSLFPLNLSTNFTRKYNFKNTAFCTLPYYGNSDNPDGS